MSPIDGGALSQNIVLLKITLQSHQLITINTFNT